MSELMRCFMREEDGMGTVEMVLIIAALVAVALFFSKQLKAFVEKIIEIVFNGDKVPDPYSEG